MFPPVFDLGTVVAPLVEMQILIADDNPDFASLLCEFLVDEGYTVEVANDGLEALHVIGERGPPQVLILDGRMPGLDGHGVLEQVRARGYDSKVAVVTAFPGRNEKRQYEQEGADVVLSKPVPMSRILSWIEGLGTV